MGSLCRDSCPHKQCKACGKNRPHKSTATGEPAQWPGIIRFMTRRYERLEDELEEHF